MSDGRPTHRRIAAGAALSLVLLVAATLVFFLDDIARATEQTYDLIGLFPTATSLREGAPIRVAGHPVGRIESIEIVPATRDANRVAVTMELPRRVAPVIRRDSRLRFVREGIADSRVIDIVPGPPARPPLRAGDTLVFVPPPDRDRVARRAGAVALDIDSLLTSARSLSRAMEPSRRAVRDIGRAATVAQREFERLRRTAEGGSLVALARDTTWRASLARLGRAADEVARAVQRMDGLSGELGREATAFRTALDRTLRRARTLSTRIERLERLLAAPRGFPSRMARDTALDAALRGIGAQIDSLAAEARSRPWRFFF